MTAIPAAASEQSRARYPDETGVLARAGVRVRWERYGNGDPAILFLPSWSIIHSRCWKMQIPDFARRHRVLTFDPRGNGGSDRPSEPAAYAEEEFAADALAVLDATRTDSAVVVGLSLGAQRALILAAEQPDRVAGLVLVAPALELGLPPSDERQAGMAFEIDTGVDEGWDRYNSHSWRRDYRGFLEFFFSQVFTEAHSTKQIEDCIGWGLEIDPATLIAAEVEGLGEMRTRELAARVRCPVLVVHGDEDAIVPHAVGTEAARITGGRLITFAGSGHCPPVRDPVRFNTAVREFIGERSFQPSWTRARSRRKRALFVCSPIGLGHARRDAAIAEELSKRHPDLEIEWLAQHPVTAFLEARGERIHPASTELANESAHLESESAEHVLHCFQAIRRMDEILTANFTLFRDIVTAGHYDLWIGDEAWELDYFLHENPELKTAAYCWLTDFVGWIPMPDGNDAEAQLCSDYNAEMIEQIARFPRIRDRAVFVGHPDDIVPETFGPGLPRIRDWTESHYDFAGYITGFNPFTPGEREAARGDLGYGPDEQVCIVAVGGSGVGGALLRKVIEAFPHAKARRPDLRMVVISGPRIDAASLRREPGLEIRAYVPDLDRHLGACDLAVIQGGLTTSMELCAHKRPFLYFPLKHHFEQHYHVRYRLQRYGAGRCMDYETATPETIAQAIAEELGRTVVYRDVETDGAARAASLIGELL